MYLFRLDDASDYMDVEKWDEIEKIFDKYSVKPIVGIIPNNEDEKFVTKYVRDDNFWDKAISWKEKGWRIALHGYNHVYSSNCGGINPVNNKSEFAGLPLEQQKEKIKKGYDLLCSKGLKPDIFFAPSHTFDKNTLAALYSETDIRIISDTIANDVYYEEGFYYIPQQSGGPRKLPFKLITICLHPNTINDMVALEEYLKSNVSKIIDANKVESKQRNKSLIDKLLSGLYFDARKIRTIIDR